MENGLILALDLGGTKLASATFDQNGSILSNYQVMVSGNSDAVGAQILKALDHHRLLAENAGSSIQAIGIAVPGIYYEKTGTVWAPNIPGWEAYPLKEQIEDYLGDHSIPVKIDSDRACYILGEYWKGVAQDCRYAIYLAVGTGIGAGILIDGKVLRGSQDIAGAIGWMSLKPDFQKPYTQYGCFEYHASGQGISIQAADHYKSTAAVFAGYEKGEERAKKIIDEAILMWGQATANLVSLFNPEMIIFGGGVFGPAVKYIDRIYEEACRWAQPVSIRQVKFLPSSLGDRVALYGAAYLAGTKITPEQ
ncbi:MAG: ROK family protein [Saprospiraceae bacterium]|nr:ROK family protein [Saprospiraceae bacterium]